MIVYWQVYLPRIALLAPVMLGEMVAEAAESVKPAGSSTTNPLKAAECG